MDGSRWDAAFQHVLDTLSGETYSIDPANRIPGVTAYCVRTFDHDALLFCIPLLVRRPLADELSLARAGADGATSCIIEQCKSRADREPALGPLLGRGTGYPCHYDAITEPYTLVHSPDAIAAHLWHADERNYYDNAGCHFLIRGALPIPASCADSETTRMSETLTRLCEAISIIVFSMPGSVLARAWENSLDQKLLRDMLPSFGLVAFIGDGARLARHQTRHRGYYRTAGPKPGVNVPFTCPIELEPVELDLPVSNNRVSGLGIRVREVFAVAGSNAQGKTTFLEGVHAGLDDHALGDGRERVVTVRGIRHAEAMNCGLAGADVSMFFSTLPPGVEGNVTAVHGRLSGSMTMAHQVGDAIRVRAPLLIIDEDRAAPNLLVRSCLQTEEITPLAEILAHDRGRMGDTSLLVAACAMDTLIAEADRIMLLRRHRASGIDRTAFRHRLAGSLRVTAEELSRE